MDIPNEVLRTFVTAAGTLNFTVTASIVHKTQSAVSMQMKRLEEDLGQSLFERDGRSIRLSFAGETLLPYARRMLKLHDEALSAIRRPDMFGRVRLGAPYDYAEQVLPAVLSRFAETWPLIQIDVVFDRGKKLEEQLNEGQLDLIIKSDIGVVQRGITVHQDSVVWVTSGSRMVHEADPLPLAAYHEECTFRLWAVKSLEAIGRDYRIAYTSPSVAGVLAAVRSGLAVAVIEKSAVPQDMRILSIDDGFPEMPTTTVSMIIAEGRQQPVVQAFAEYIVASFKELQSVNTAGGLVARR